MICPSFFLSNCGLEEATGLPQLEPFEVSVNVDSRSANHILMMKICGGNTAEGGEIEHPELIPPLKNILQWYKTKEEAKNQEEILGIYFKQGIPIKLSDITMKLSDLINKCSQIGTKHGMGIFSSC